MEHVGIFPYPLIGYPLGAKDDRTASMEHRHVRTTAGFQIVPKDG